MGDNAGSFMLGFWVGALAGAAAALLMAPQSGDETIRLLQEKGIELKDQAQQTAQQVSGTIKDQVGQVDERGRVVISEKAKNAQQRMKGSAPESGAPAV